MSLSSGRQAAINALKASWNNGNTPDQTAAAMVDAIIALVQGAAVTVPGTGLVAPSGGGPVTGSVTGASLS